MSFPRILALFSNPYRDGSTISTLETIKGLKEWGAEILVVVREEGFLTEELRKLKIKYIISSLPFWQLPPIKNCKDRVKFFPRIAKIIYRENDALRKLNKIIKDWRPSIIYTNVSVIDIGYKAARKSHLPHIWHIREYGDLDFEIKPMTGKKRLHEKLMQSYCVCITKDLKKYHHLGEGAEVIYNPIVQDKGTKRLQKENVIIFVGRITENKGATEVIESFIAFSSTNNEYELVLLGRCNDNDYLNYLKKLVTENGLENRIHFKGQVENVSEWMQKAKAIIVASKAEGFGRITAEAMLNRCLVIGKDTAGTKEQFDNGRELWNKEIGIRYTTQKELVSGLHIIADMSDSEYKDILDHAYLTVEQLYNQQNHLNKIKDLIKSLK